MTSPYDPQQQPYEPQQQPYQPYPSPYELPYGQQYGQPYGQPYYGPPPEHPQANTALILGILGLVLCQVLGPFAFVMGRKVMREIDASGGTIGGRGNAQVGYILGIVSTVLLGIVAVFMVIYVVVIIIAIVSTSTT